MRLLRVRLFRQGESAAPHPRRQGAGPPAGIAAGRGGANAARRTAGKPAAETPPAAADAEVAPVDAVPTDAASADAAPAVSEAAPDDPVQAFLDEFAPAAEAGKREESDGEPNG